MSDSDLARVLDDALHRALQDNNFSHMTDRNGEDATLVHLTSDRLDPFLIEGEIYLLVKDDKHDPAQKTVVTVLTESMISRHFHAEKKDGFNNGMATQLKDVVIPTKEEQPMERAAVTPEDDPYYIVISDGVILGEGNKDHISTLVGQLGDRGKVYREVPVHISAEIGD